MSQCISSSCYFGTCLNDTCICPSNFRDDDLFFSQPNSCTLTTISYVALFIEVTILAFFHISYLIYLAKRQGRNKARILVYKSIISIFTCWLTILSLFLENGAKEASIFWVIAFVMSLLVLGRGFVVLTLSPLIGLANVEKPLHTTKVFTILANVIFGIIGVIWLVYRKDQVIVNTIVCIFHFATVCVDILMCGTVYIMTNSLTKEVQHMHEITSSLQGRKEKIEKLLLRLKFFQKMILMFCAISAPPLLILPIVYLSLGFFPFSWIIHFVTFNVSFVASWATVVLVKKHNSIKTDSQPVAGDSVGANVIVTGTL